MRLERLALLLGACLLLACSSEVPPPAPAVDTVKSNDGTWSLRIEPPLTDCVLNEPCSFAVTVEGFEGVDLPGRMRLEVDAAMPDHRHGLNARPTVRKKGEGRYSVEGLLLHMPGYWEVYFDLTTGAVTERAQVALER